MNIEKGKGHGKINFYTEENQVQFYISFIDTLSIS